MLISFNAFKGFEEIIQGQFLSRFFKGDNGKIRTEIALLSHFGRYFAKSFFIVLEKHFCFPGCHFFMHNRDRRYSI